MPYVAPVEQQQASQEARELFGAIEQKLGAVPNIFRTMAHHPPVLQATLAMSEALAAQLPDKLRELAYLKASLVNQCHY